MKTLENTGLATDRPISEKLSKWPETAGGVAVVDGYGIQICVDKRHLVIRDGRGCDRRERRYTKVAHRLSRLVVIGRTGSVTLEALRWMDRTGIAFVHIETNGQVLTASATPGLDDARLRRAQALATNSSVGTEIARHLLAVKITRQAETVRSRLDGEVLADRLEDRAQHASESDSITEATEIEAAAAKHYFAAWTDRVEIQWATKDLPRIPDHWQHFAGRRSPLASGSAIRAADPLNALLNYLYALAEAECRFACLTLGLDPGMGIVHADSKNRDSLALDLIEVVRPHVDAYVIDLAEGHTFSHADFHEAADGQCRILAPLTHHLAATMGMWRAVVAPHTEWVAHRLADASPYQVAKHTPLTSAIRRGVATEAAKSRRKSPDPIPPASRSAPIMRLPKCCPDCGTPVRGRVVYCPGCWMLRRVQAGRAGSALAAQQLNQPGQRERRGQAITAGRAKAFEQAATAAGYKPDHWDRRLSHRVSRLTLVQIMEATALSQSYASKIKRGINTPHPRHWSDIEQALAGPRTDER